MELSSRFVTAHDAFVQLDSYPGILAVLLGSGESKVQEEWFPLWGFGRTVGSG